MDDAPTGDLRLRELTSSMLSSLGLQNGPLQFSAQGDLPSIFAVADFAAAAIATAGTAAAQLIATRGGAIPAVSVSRRLASLWFGSSIQPIGWSLPAPWDPIAGDYLTSDGWIRLHTNAPHHRAAALAVLGVSAERSAVARAVASWNAGTLESAIVDQAGCAAVMRSMAEWSSHPQGASVAQEALMATRVTTDRAAADWPLHPARPLAGIRVLDLTRVLAGPVATRFLAGLGADVLRIDPPDWDEPGVTPDVTLGKRCTRLDLHNGASRAIFLDLLHGADVLVHGYRPDALERLGLDVEVRRAVRPGLVDVCLSAYGWTGPWRRRRGFDSLVQMSAGIADAGMRALGRDRPAPLPVQALDHATGYLMAAAVIRGLIERAATGRGFEARASLARTARLLVDTPSDTFSAEGVRSTDEDWSATVEASGFGTLRRLQSPLSIAGMPLRWDRAASALGSAAPAW